MIKILKKAGPLRNGWERGKGSVYHAVEIPEGRKYVNQETSLCGTSPAIMWSTSEGEKVTCPRCLKKMEGRG